MAFFFFLIKFSRRVMISDGLYVVGYTVMVVAHHRSDCEEQSQLHIFCLLSSVFVVGYSSKIIHIRQSFGLACRQGTEFAKVHYFKQVLFSEKN